MPFWEMIQNGGHFVVVLVTLIPVCVAIAMVASAVSAFRIWIPLPVWLSPLVLMVLAGFMGSLQGMDQAVLGTAVTPSELKATMAAGGLAVSLYTEAIAFTFAAWLAALFAWLAALSHLRSRAGDGWAPVPAAAAAGTVVIVSILVAGLFFYFSGPYVQIPLFLTLIGLPMAVAALRVSDQARSGARLADGRVICTALAMFGAASMAASYAVMGRILVFRAQAIASIETEAIVIATGQELQTNALIWGAASTLIIAAIGGVLAALVVRQLRPSRIGINLIGTVVLLAIIGVAAAGDAFSSAVLEEVIAKRFGVAPSEHLQEPSHSSTRAPHHRQVDLFITQESVLLAGGSMLYLQNDRDPATGQSNARPLNAQDQAEFAKSLADGPQPDPMVIQADKRLRMAVITPVLQAVERAGVKHIELLIITDSGRFVVPFPVPSVQTFSEALDLQTVVDGL